MALGALWHSHDSLFLYGGMSSWQPPVPPPSNSLWEYQIKSSTWIEHKDPKTSAGNNSEPSGTTVQRAAEGAHVSIPDLGRGWYFGGHQDGYTTEGWSQSIPRIYLKSFLEYTFPGYSNDGIEGLASEKAGSDGAWRNITQAGVQNTPGFTERADGLLVYVPGFGEEGILLALAGGVGKTFVSPGHASSFLFARLLYCGLSVAATQYLFYQPRKTDGTSNYRPKWMLSTSTTLATQLGTNKQPAALRPKCA